MVSPARFNAGFRYLLILILIQACAFEAPPSIQFDQDGSMDVGLPTGIDAVRNDMAPDVDDLDMFAADVMDREDVTDDPVDGHLPPSVEEQCNGLDDDRDGQVDEGVLNACGECGDLHGDICDGLDNDCDGSVDEGCDCPLGMRRECGLDIGACVLGQQVCEDGGWSSCMDAIDPSPEVCNGHDDDCDGHTDEILTRHCGVDVGECEAGTQVCEDGQWGECSNSVLPAVEVCDGLDNDCDGETDELEPQPCGRNQGTCQHGQRLCIGGEWSHCMGNIEPAEEVCDGLDNDCDGEVDELEPQSCGRHQGTCQQGQRVCIGGEWSNCMGNIGPAEEVCDGLDNDCDGRIDNLDPEPCGQNRGTCVRGERMCANGEWSDCIGRIDPVDEICDGQDNDCDGQNDEALSQNCGSNVGVCMQGSQVCIDGQWGVCMGAVIARLENCDGLDNDCDGSVDEELPMEAECEADAPIYCSNGEWNLCDEHGLVP